MSLHAHASDALHPTTIASLLINTGATSPLVLHSPTLAPRPDERPEDTGQRVRAFALDLLGWNETHVREPKFVYEVGGYGAGYGPLAHASKEWEINAIAAGPKPVLVNIRTASKESLDTLLAEAKAQGCIAALIDLVSTEDGSILPPERLGMLKESCARHKLLLIVDETMTAIRCGAPFTFQRSEYAAQEPDLQPDLVIFGKGLGVSGIALNFNGALIKALGYTETADMKQTILYYRALVSRPIGLPTLIEAYGILRNAEAQNWPERSVRIGETIRDILYELEPQTRDPGVIRGLAAMIALDKKYVTRFGIMGAIRRRSPIVRWLPSLSAAYADRRALMENVFGPESRKNRQKLSAEADRSGFAPLWCFVCGIQAVSQDWCRECFLAYCNNEVCVKKFGEHEHVGA
ncbi:pyridoxal phosphate-dependent transferase [Chaetomium sp. MPI-CAGE-AT-0009]|nr:pyridoxal phosphate-dependent transferase [Chaetomium sp. MPI-CAGE-AT-0009]